MALYKGQICPCFANSTHTAVSFCGSFCKMASYKTTLSNYCFILSFMLFHYLLNGFLWGQKLCKVIHIIAMTQQLEWGSNKMLTTLKVHNNCLSAKCGKHVYCSKGIPSQFLTEYLVTLNFLDHCTSQPACSLGKQAQVYSGLCQQQYSRAGQKRMDHFRRHDTFSHFPQSHIPLCKCPIMRITRTEFFVSALILRPRS